MEDLFVATAENVQLAVRERCEAVFVERLTGRRSVSVLTRVGDSFALHATGVGSSCSRTRPQEVQEEVLSRPLRTWTDYTMPWASTGRGDPAEALGRPGLVPWIYWLVLVLMVAAVGAGALLLWRRIGALKHKTTHDPRRLAGVATGRDLRTAASRKALLKHGRTLRPSLDHPAPSDIGYLLGRSRSREVWASVEDSILLLRPPRSGKGLHVVINAILDAPGAVITTATRPDNIAATITEESTARPSGRVRSATARGRAARRPPLVARPRL